VEILDSDHSTRIGRESAKSVTAGIVAGSLVVVHQEAGTVMMMIAAAIYYPLAMVFFEFIERGYDRPESVQS